MFVYSLKTSKRDLIMFAIALIFFIAAVIFAFLPDSKLPASAAIGGVECRGGTAGERIGFLNSFGWEINAQPTEVREVIIPIDFSDVYSKYNELQIKQGFDLEKYKGKRVKLWTYEVLNYPGHTGVYANMLVYNDEIIGGDICSYELAGFMHGFSPSSAASSAEDH